MNFGKNYFDFNNLFMYFYIDLFVPKNLKFGVNLFLDLGSTSDSVSLCCASHAMRTRHRQDHNATIFHDGDARQYNKKC